MNLIHVLEAVFAFSFMIFIHEGGHYLASQFFKVEVEEFALGFGTTLISRKWGKTVYAIRAVPLGGFCKMKGGDLSSNSAEEMYLKPAEKGDFLFAAWWKRVVILLAGPGMNFVSALLIVTALFVLKGEPMEVIKPLLGFVTPGSLAEKAGLKKNDLLLTVNGKAIDNLNTAEDLLPDYGKSSTITYERNHHIYTATIERGPKSSEPVDLGIIDLRPAIVGQALLGNPARNAGIQEGDEITQVNGRKVGDWAELAYLIRNLEGDSIQVEFFRNKVSHAVTIDRIFNGSFKAIGISPIDASKPEYIKVSLFKAVGDATNYTLGLTKKLVDGVVQLFSGKVSLKSAAGPVTIMRLFQEQASQGWEDLLHAVAVISLVLFIMNLLPLGVVDGGQIVLCLIEAVKRSPVSAKAQMIYQQVGFFLVIGLMAFAVFNDFKNIFLEVHNHIK
jgi:regulator of sigma E protease